VAHDIAANLPPVYEAAPELLKALRLYVKLDNDRRSGCRLSADDWGECYSAADRAIAMTKGGS
jgi:hypothetical protein